MVKVLNEIFKFLILKRVSKKLYLVCLTEVV